MKVKKKGISSILGALIFLQILLISLLLVIHVINNETNVTLKSVQRFKALSEYAPITEYVENNVTYLYSTFPFTITHVIYPNEEIVNTTILVKNRLPVSQILNGYPWAIIVTSQGTWYNVTLLGGSNGQRIIIFPYYHDFGYPLDPSVLDVNQSPNWNVLEGIVGSSGLSLVPVNVTIGDPTTYSWALTDAVLVVYPNSSTGWTNITFYQPLQHTMFFGGGEYVYIYPYTFPGEFSVTGVSNAPIHYYYDRVNASLGIYIPNNITATFALNASHRMFTENISILQYSYIYVNEWEVTNLQYEKLRLINYNSSWFATQIGTYIWNLSYGTPQGEIEFPFINYYFPSYPLDNPLNDFRLIKSISMPPFNWYPTAYVWNHTYDGAIYIRAAKNVNVHSFPVTIYKIAINLYKGEVLDYGYDSFNNSWILLYNYTFDYNNPASYLEAYKLTNGGYSFLGCAVPNGHGGYTLEPLSYKYYDYYNSSYYYGDIYLYNIDNIEYLMNYPVYIVVPQGTYLLQVSLS